MMKKFSFVLAAMFLMVFAVGIASAVSGPPSCSFEASAVSGPEDFTTTFTGTAYNMSMPFSYHWDFGDGVGAEVTSIHTISPITHTYLNPGKYTVSLAVYDTGFPVTMWYESKIVDYITVTNTPPTVSIAPLTQTVHLGERAEFSSTVTGNDITSYVWSFGDGHFIPPTGTAPYIPATSIVYENTGTYGVSLAVTNDGGTTVSDGISVTVIPPLPVAAFTGSPQLGQVPLAVKFYDETPEVMEIDTYLWDFGDGATSGEENPLHAYGAVGTYDVSLTVTSISGTDTVMKADFVTVTEGSPFTCPTPADNVGVFRPASGQWFLDTTFTGTSPFVFSFGKNGDVGITGDWNGDGIDNIGVVRNGNTWILDKSGDGHFNTGDVIYVFGRTGDQYITGDWNADGADEIGVIRNGNQWILDYNGDGKFNTGDKNFLFGSSPDTKVIGTWQLPI